MSSTTKSSSIMTTSPKTYVYVGRDVLRYRTKVDSSPSTQVEVESKKPSDFIEHSHEELLSQINLRLQRPSRAYLIALGSVVGAGLISLLTLLNISQKLFIIESIYLFCFFSPLLAAATIFILGVVATLIKAGQEKRQRITTLCYKFDKEAKTGFGVLQDSLAALASSSFVWQIVSRSPNWDWKRQAGASSVVDRKQVAIGYMSPPFIESNIKTYGLEFGTTRLFFLPDQLLLYRQGKYTGIHYSGLAIDAFPTRFIEHERVPRDSEVVDYTWQYVRKDGGPDLRFANNRRIPVVQYGHIELSSSPVLSLELHVSNLAHAQRFAGALEMYVYLFKDLHTRSSGRRTSGRQRRSEKSNAQLDESPYNVLNIKPGATKEEIVAAYRRMVQMYHPDKVAGLAPEFRQIAEERMKTINAAYEELERSF